MKKFYVSLFSVISVFLLFLTGYILPSVPRAEAQALVPPPTSETTVSSTLPSVAIGGAATLITNSTTAAIVLKWSSENDTSCTASGAWSGTQPLSGESVETPSSTGQSIYTLTCSGAGGTASASAIVTAPPSRSLAPPTSPASSTTTTTSTVLAEIQQATSTQAIYALAEGAGFTVTSSTVRDGSPEDTVTSILATDARGTVLAAATEWNEKLLPPATSTALLFLPRSGSSLFTATTILLSPTVSLLSGSNILRDLGDLFAPAVACAQAVPSGSMVVGNNTGSSAICSLSGSNGTASIIVYSNGQPFGVSGNYQFDEVDQGTDTDLAYTAAVNTYGIAGENEIQSLGGPLALASANGNLISLVINEDPTTNQIAANAGEDGLALSISTQQSGGTYDNSCVANLFLLNLVQNMQGIPGASLSVYVQNLSAHEIGHCLGLGHTDDPNNAMYGGGVSAVTPSTFNAAQIQYLKDLVAGNTIQVDPGSCTQACDNDEGYVSTIDDSAGSSCKSQQDLCGSQPGTVWDDQAQQCLDCPSGTSADLDAGQCVSLTTCSEAQIAMGICSIDCQADPLDPICLASGLPNTTSTHIDYPICKCNGSNLLCTEADGSNPVSNYNPTCAAAAGCNADDPVASPDCTLPTSTIPTPPTSPTNSDPNATCTTNSDGLQSCACNSGYSYSSDSTLCQHSVDCTASPGNPVCPGNFSYCSDNPGDSSCPGSASYCESNPQDSSCSTPTDYCALNPSDPDCATYCTSNSDDTACIGDDNICLNDPSDPSCTISGADSYSGDAGTPDDYDSIWLEPGDKSD